MQIFRPFTRKFIYKSSSFRFEFNKIASLLQIYPTVPKLLNFDKFLKSNSSLKKVCIDKNCTLKAHDTLSLC